MQRDSGIETSNITATMHSTSFSQNFLTLHSPILLVKTIRKCDLVDLIYDVKVFVTSMPSLGPYLLLRGRNMAD